MGPEEFRAAGHELIDWIADYRARVPQPSSTLSRPASSAGSTPACASGIFQIPQLGSAAAQFRRPGPA